MNARVYQLRAETRYRKGSDLVSASLGRCRVRQIERDRVALVASNKPIGAEPDVWCKVDNGFVIDPNNQERLKLA